ncbi:uncharacterized protein METZ01_LOCUS59122 [marine metagenome]|uniref:Uncharacterized protein n=1 Tax=marine metagenome TaxID=408172 RepID=A0A381SSG1_9ZZZZ
MHALLCNSQGAQWSQASKVLQKVRIHGSAKEG